MDEITIRKRLNALRIDSHVTFEFMEVRSKELGIPMSPAALSKVENGKTRLKFAHIDLYSKILEVSHEKILL